MSEKREPQLGCTAVVMPCPFCGSADIDVEGWKNGKGDTGPQCLSCGATCESVVLWNMRLGDTCRLGCKITRAVQEMNDSLTSKY